MTNDEATRDFPKKKSKKRRADGSLRPVVQRRRQRDRKKRAEERLAAMPVEERERLRAEREAWLARFEPGARAAFSRETRLDETIWLRAFAAEVGLPQEEAAPLLEQTADERMWLKLKTKDGMCVGIAPFHRRKKKKPKIHVPENDEGPTAVDPVP